MPMIKGDLEAMLPEIQKRYSEITDETKRLEGDFRTIQGLVSKWVEQEDPTTKGAEKEQAVDAQTNSPAS